MPAEAFGRVPQINKVVLSPGGSLLAWTDDTGTVTRVIMYDIATGKYKRVLPVDHSTKVRQLHWLDDDTLLISVNMFETIDRSRGARQWEFSRTLAFDANGGHGRVLLMEGGERARVLSSHVVNWYINKPKTVIMTSYDYSAAAALPELGTRLQNGRADSGWVPELFEVDTRTGNGTRIGQGTAFTRDWVVDKAGNVVARGDWDARSGVYTILAKNGLAWREILREYPHGAPSVHGLTADRTAIYLSGTAADGHVTLRALPLDGSPQKVLIEDATRDVSQISMDTITGTLVGGVLGGLEDELVWIDKDAEQQYRMVAAAFQGKSVRILGRSANNQYFLAAVYGLENPVVWYLVDMVKHKADIVGEAYPVLKDVPLAKVRTMTYKARDGALVPAYLITPPGVSEKALPLIVFPHDGPARRDLPEFDWYAQFLAVRGYAVLEPQYRGSSGFGEAWRLAGVHQWGGVMQNDLVDGVKALVDQGVADPARVGIMGRGYGGFAALAGVAFTPEIFRCAVSINGISNLPEMIGYIHDHHGTESDALSYWHGHVGAATDSNVIQKSPVHAAQWIKSPVLLLHATEDTVVPPIQSDEMNHALASTGKTVKYVKLPGDDHWLSRSETRVQVLEEADEFFAAHLPKSP